MKKSVAFIILSFVSFISLTIISFNLSTEKTQTPKVETKVDKSLQTISKVKVSNKTFSEEDTKYVIKDLKANIQKNNVLLTWSNESIEDLQTLNIIRTPLKGEGEYVVYDVFKSPGRFTDKNVKPGMLYYYELSGKTKKGSVYSALATAKIPGDIVFSIDSNYMLINGEKEYYESSKKSQPFEVNDTIMLPIKGAAEALGAKVNWTRKNGKVNTKSAIFIYNNTEIELFVGQNDIIINRVPAQTEVAPVVKSGVLYASYMLIENNINCSIRRDGGYLLVTKDTEVDEPKREELYEDINANEGSNLQLTVEDAQNDSKKWYYSIDDSDALEMQLKTVEKGIGSKQNSVFNFKALKKGKFKLVMKYFNPRFGDVENGGILLYNINVT